MEQKFVKINKNQARSFKKSEVLADVDDSARFIAMDFYAEQTGDVPTVEEQYFLASWPDTEMYQNNPAFEELTYQVEDGVMIPMSWEQEIPRMLMGFQDGEEIEIKMDAAA